jgi:hypothetical protein
MPRARWHQFRSVEVNERDRWQTTHRYGLRCLLQVRDGKQSPRKLEWRIHQRTEALRTTGERLLNWTIRQRWRLFPASDKWHRLRQIPSPSCLIPLRSIPQDARRIQPSCLRTKASFALKTINIKWWAFPPLRWEQNRGWNNQISKETDCAPMVKMMAWTCRLALN